MDIVELRPCPFCGGEAERFTIGDDEPNNAGGDVICCTKCQASSHVEFGYKENLVSRWNTRADERYRSLLEETEENVERVVSLIEAPFTPHGYELKPHLLKSAAVAILKSITEAVEKR